jgi:hypothetical protein
MTGTRTAGDQPPSGRAAEQILHDGPLRRDHLGVARVSGPDRQGIAPGHARVGDLPTLAVADHNGERLGPRRSQRPDRRGGPGLEVLELAHLQAAGGRERLGGREHA